MSNFEVSLLSFVCGWGCSLILEEIGKQIEKYNKIKEKIADYERKENACPHGHEDWDDCPDCCH